MNSIEAFIQTKSNYCFLGVFFFFRLCCLARVDHFIFSITSASLLSKKANSNYCGFVCAEIEPLSSLVGCDTRIVLNLVIFANIKLLTGQLIGFQVANTLCVHIQRGYHWPQDICCLLIFHT